MIERTRKEKDFTQIDNWILRDPGLSLKAKGALAILLSFKDDFNFHVETLVSMTSNGRGAVQTALDELRNSGFIHLWRRNGESGHIISGYDVYESPEKNPHFEALERTATLQKSDSGKGAHLRRLDVGTCWEEPKAWWGRNLDDWEAALQEKGCKPRRRDKTIDALCPCHKDTKPSLTVKQGKVRPVIATCHSLSKCKFEDIAEFLFGGRIQTGVPVYTYVDEKDQPLFRVLRYGDKDFLCQTFGQNGWSRRLRRGTRRVPYRLVQLLAGIKSGVPIWIVEGEKDAETFRAKVQVATCNAFGAGRWSCDLNDHFKGARVTIVADKDSAGYEHARSVRSHLYPVAETIRVVVAAGNETINDATDHFEAGYGIDDFVEIDLDTESRAA